MRNQITAKKQAEHIAIDMQLAGQLNSINYKNQNLHFVPKSINELIKLLNGKNKRYSFTKDQIDSSSQIQNTTINFNAMVKKGQKYKNQYSNMGKQKAKEIKYYFYGNLKQLNNKNYISKTIEYAIYNPDIYDFQLSKVRAHDLLITENKKIINSFILNQQNPPYIIENTSKLTIKIQQYLKQIAMVLATSTKIHEVEWAAIFRSSTKLKIWEIFHSLTPKFVITKFFQQSQDKHLYKLALISLKLVQSEFDTILPSTFDKQIMYLKTKYLQNYKGSNDDASIFWGLAFLLYRAGRKKQFYDALPDLQIREMFIKVDDSISLQKPYKIEIEQTRKNVFQDQLIYALSGTAKYSCQSVCDINHLDIVWVLLRNVGIFVESQIKFKQLQEDIYLSYKNQHLDQDKIRNLIYLLCFDQLVELGPNELIDEVDYLHFLIMVYHNRFFKQVCITRLSLLQKKLTQRLVEAIQILCDSNNNHLIYYIILVPVNNLASEVSSIIAQKKYLQKLNWQDLRRYISIDVFHKLAELSCSKYAQITGQYVLASEYVKNLTKSSNLSLQILIKMFGKSMIQNNIAQYQLRRGYSFYLQLIQSNQQLRNQYCAVFEFFKQYRDLNKLIQQRNQQSIYSFLKKCKHILVSKHLKLDTKQVLQKLISNNFFDCFIIYMRLIIYAYKISLIKLDRPLDLRQVQSLALQAITNLIKQQQFNQFNKKQYVLAFITELQEELYRFS